VRGGDLGLVRVGELAEPLRTVAAALPAGAISRPVRTAEGYVLLMRER
jgi:parvulin-like peptidyl-prolyl isomerase